MLRILFVEDSPAKMRNPFLESQIKSLEKFKGEDVICAWGKKEFWDDGVFKYDIVHIMWPQFILLDHDLEELRHRLMECRSKGVKIVSTCHNIEPHYSSNERAIDSYKIVYSNSDLILHLGNYSLHLFKEKYPNAKNVLLYHHIYDDRYKMNITQNEAKAKLGLDKNKKYILCFGAFRNDEERMFVGDLSNQFRSSTTSFLAPSFYTLPGGRKPIKRFMAYLRGKKTRERYRNLFITGKAVNDLELPLYFKAADVVLIQRLKILNSGNLPLAFYMGKVVVGPDIGNVGEILKETGNPVFDTKDFSNLKRVVQEALNLASQGKGEENRKYAFQHYSSQVIGEKLYDYYRQIVG